MKKELSRERQGKEKKKGERKGTGNIGEAREESPLYIIQDPLLLVLRHWLRTHPIIPYLS
jgi:hypothetical protein